MAASTPFVKPKGLFILWKSNVKTLSSGEFKYSMHISGTVWVNAAAQNFNSIGIAFGSMIALSSYNKRQNKILKDVLIICSLNSATFILAGFAVFSILGNISFNQGRNITDLGSLPKTELGKKPCLVITSLPEITPIKA